MDKNGFEQAMIQKGISSGLASQILKGYSEIVPFSYSLIKTSNKRGKFRQAFGSAYDEYGIYVFYNPNTEEVKYIGEAASEPFSKRLTQHFNGSHGGLPIKKPTSQSVLKTCEVLILYGKYTNAQARNTHFDEDLLIGTFRPPLNDR